MNQEYEGGGTLIVLTDGEENRSPRVSEVYDDVIASVSLIAHNISSLWQYTRLSVGVAAGGRPVALSTGNL